MMECLKLDKVIQLHAYFTTGSEEYSVDHDWMVRFNGK